MRVLGVIPARYAARRFPGKALAKLLGKPMLQHVWERARQVSELDELLIATDDERICRAAEAFGAQVLLTSPEHLSGTDRLGEVAARYPEFTHLINIQGDEPALKPEQIAELVAILGLPDTPIATLCHALEDPRELQRPDVVKVAVGTGGYALYFSRAPIPYHQKAPESTINNLHFRHVGLYGYRRETLLRITQLDPHALENAEGLEQLRWLANGYAIRVGQTVYSSLGVDTPQDLPHAEELLKARLAEENSGK